MLIITRNTLKNYDLLTRRVYLSLVSDTLQVFCMKYIYLSSIPAISKGGDCMRSFHFLAGSDVQSGCSRKRFIQT